MSRILVIENDEAVRVTIRAVLARSGYEVQETKDGGEGLTLASAWLPDLVICGIRLAGLSGWDVLAGLRVGAATSTIPVIMMTASHEAADMRQSMNLGADDFLQKPFTRDELLAAVAARQRRRQALRGEIERTNQQLRQMLELMEDLVVIVDPGTLAVRYMNRAARELTGHRAAGSVGLLAVEQLFPADSWHVIRVEGLPRALEHGAWAGEVEWRRHDGGVIPVQQRIRALRAFGGEVDCLSLIARDLTEQRRATDQIRTLMRAVEQNPVSIVITDPAGCIEYVNPYFERVTGYTAAEVIGVTPRILESDKRSQEEYQEIWDTVLRGDGWRGEVCNRRKDGTEYWELACISPVRAPDGRVTHFIAVKQDISERRILELQLRQAQKLKAIGQLAAGIAHEINTPIQYIGDNLQFISGVLRRLDGLMEACGRLVEGCGRGVPEPELVAECRRLWEASNVDFLRTEIPEAVEQSVGGVERIAGIVRAMKDFSHPGVEEKARVDLNRLVESTLTVSRNEWKYVAQLEASFDEDLGSVPCLPGEFNQVILNLVVNAAHAMADAQAAGAPPGKGILRVITRRLGGWAEVRVGDTGTGIPEGVRERIFEPFFTTKSVGCGTGQGLALARSVIVDKHGGTLTFETEVGVGTTFVLRIPLAGTDPAQAAGGGEPRCITTGGGT